MSLSLGLTWHVAAMIAHLCGAAAAAIAGTWIAGRRDRFGPAGTAVAAALYVTTFWCLSHAASPSPGPIEDLIESARNLAWLFALYRLFSGDGRHRSLAPIRPLVLSLAFVELLHAAATLLMFGIAQQALSQGLAFQLSVMFRLLFVAGGLVLVHNLYLGASGQTRLALRWPALALAVIWGCDLNFYTVAYLAGGWPEELGALRGIAAIAAAALLALGAAQGREALRLRPSRAVTFQTVSLLVIGAYLVAMVAIAQWLAYVGGDFARLIGFTFVIAASVAAVFILPSRRLRGWLRVTLSKHLFQHRYDYRAEWLRFTRTIGREGGESHPLEERVVQAVADIAESPAGLLLAPGDHGELVLAARWQWPAAEVPAVAMNAAATAFFERDGFIVDLDDLRAGKVERGEAQVLPAWLIEETRAWALVPLLHFERLAGVVVLARPQMQRKLDWEDFDLLRVAGQQLASYLAERTGQAALAEASRFDDFHRRIAFVMHDIKNLASQLSLLARNAEKHADKPDFRDDMLVTLRNSADKLNALLARLSRYGGEAGQIEDVAGAEVAKAVVARFHGQHPVMLTECRECDIAANRESLEQVLVHLLQNAVDASTDGSPVFLSLTVDGLSACFEIVDSGEGMSPEFVRTKLFKPFVSSKQGGFGIGAFEARELVRAMNGRLDVESREGLGSRFVVRLPLAAATDAYRNFAQAGQIAGQKVA